MRGSGGRMVLSLSVSALAALVLSCTSTTGPELPDLSGSWTGANEQVALTLTLTEARFGEVSGTGTLNSGSSSFPLIVQGEHRHPGLSLTLRLSQDEEVRLDGTLVEGAAVSGSLDGLGFDRMAITLVRLALAGGGQ